MPNRCDAVRPTNKGEFCILMSGHKGSHCADNVTHFTYWNNNPNAKECNIHHPFQKTTQGMDFYLPTFTGKKFHFLDPYPNEIDIKDIAHSLAGLPRYLCHTERPYSVAEHCVRLVEYARVVSGCTDSGARCVLLHDGAEAYVGEWPKPLKLSIIGESLRVYEGIIQHLVFQKFGCVYDPITRRQVEQLDRAIVYAETVMSGQMDYDNLPIPLTQDEEWLGQQMFEFFRDIGLGPFGWGHSISESRFLSMAKILGIDGTE